MTSLDEAVRALTPEAWAAVEPLLDRFESAWERGERPRIEDYAPSDPSQRRAALVELVHIDIERRVALGESARLEEYAARFPEIAGDASAHAVTVSPLTTPRFGRERPGTPASAPAEIPGYDLLEELGRGGTGVVYKAWEPALKRVVALKMLLAGTLADAEERTRFRREAEAVARLQHPHIVQIHGIGEHAGRAFLALEYLEGGSLQAHLAGNPQEPRAAAALVETLARTIHFAHQRGIVHRDLKPANILLASAAPQGVKITDFGLAKHLDDDSPQTRSGAIVGTPSYMAPEQAEGRVKDIGPATDIYALGAILYELLTGRPPFRSALVLDTLEQVRSQEPVAPSRLQPKVPRDLENVCLKCLHKDPRHRYADAGMLADEVQRFLDGRPVQARSLSVAGRLVKWARRRPAVAALVAMIVLVASVGFAGVVWQWRQAQTELERAEANLYAQRIALADREWLANHADRAAQLLAECPPERCGWEWHYLTRLNEGGFRPLATGNALGVAFSPDGKYLAVAAIDTETVQVWDLHESRVVRRFPGMGPGVAFSPDGKYLASATWQLGSQGEAVVDQPAAVVVWEMPGGREVARLAGHAGPVFALAFDHEGKRLASASLDRTVRVWDVPGAGPLFTYRGHAGWVEGVAFEPRGRRIASAGTDGSVRVWDALTGTDVAVFTGNPDDGKRVKGRMDASKGTLVTDRDPPGVNRPDRLKVWNSATGQMVMPLRGQLHDLHTLAFAPDGQRLAAGFANVVRVFDVHTQQPALTLRGHTDLVRGIAFDAEGKRLASASYDQSIMLWNTVSGEPMATLRGHAAPVNLVAFRADGTQLASSGWDGVVRLWDLTRTGEALTLRGHTDYVRGVAFSRTGVLATAGADRVVRLWDLNRIQEVRKLQGHTDTVNGVVFNADGTRLATAGYDHTVRVWNASDGALLQTLSGHGGKVFNVAFSPNGTEVASASEDQAVRVWNVTTGEARLTLRGHSSRVFGVAYQSDGRRLVSASDDGTIRLWDARSGETVWVAKGHEGDITNLAFSPDGKRIASSGFDRTVRLWDAASGRELRAFRGHANAVTSVAFSADGRRLASVSLDRAVKVWDAHTGQELLAPRGMSSEALGVAFSQDGVFLAATCVDGTVSVWNAGKVER